MLTAFPSLRSTRWFVPSICLGAIGLIVVALVGYILVSRAELLEQAQETTRSLSLSLAGQADDSTARVDHILSGIAEILRFSPHGARAGHPEIAAMLKRRAAFLEQSRGIIVIDAGGRLIHDTTAPLSETPVDVTDRPYFRVHAERADAGLFVGEPVMGRRSGQSFVAMSRRLEDAQGRFAGVVTALVDPQLFAAFYHSVAVGGDAAVLLLHANGRVLARYPENERFVGASLAGTAPFVGAEPEGMVEMISPLDGKRRLLAWKRAEHHPLTVVVSMGRDAVLAQWQRRLPLALVLGGGLILIIAGLGAMTMRFLERRERAIGELIEAKQNSDLANRAKTQFLANMSHELRTPLNAVIGFSEVLSAGIFGPLNTKQQEYVDDITEAGRQLLEFISTLLDISKLESDAYQVRQDEHADVVEVARLCLRQVAVKAAEKNLVLHLDAPEALVVRGDERAIRQILWNLLGNAVKFTPARGRIDLVVRVGAEHVELAVRDTGIGIPADALEDVFSAFHQIDNAHTRGQDGIGLGLYLVRTLAERLGGSVAIASEPGRGTLVTVKLPAKRVVA